MKEQQFLNYVETYKDTIYRIAFNFFRNAYDADDAVQEVLMKLYIEEKEFESEEHIRYWLVRVTINHCKNACKNAWWKRHVALEERCEPVTFETTEQSELFILVMDLPEKYRVVLYLYYYEGFSVKEIGGLLAINTSAVTTRLTRARKRLKLELMEGVENGK